MYALLYVLSLVDNETHVSRRAFHRWRQASKERATYRYRVIGVHTNIRYHRSHVKLGQEGALLLESAVFLPIVYTPTEALRHFLG